MAAALRRLFTRFSRRERSVTWRGCPCTDEGEFPVVLFDGALPGEFELPTAGDVEWLLFSYT